MFVLASIYFKVFVGLELGGTIVKSLHLQSSEPNSMVLQHESYPLPNLLKGRKQICEMLTNYQFQERCRELSQVVAHPVKQPADLEFH